MSAASGGGVSAASGGGVSAASGGGVSAASGAGDGGVSDRAARWWLWQWRRSYWSLTAGDGGDGCGRNDEGGVL